MSIKVAYGEMHIFQSHGTAEGTSIKNNGIYISGIGNLLGGWARSVKAFYHAGQMDTKLIRTCISQNLVSLC